jgi:hypothetical protein
LSQAVQTQCLIKLERKKIILQSLSLHKLGTTEAYDVRCKSCYFQQDKPLLLFIWDPMFSKEIYILANTEIAFEQDILF